jgi:hypothetical protein
VLIKLDPEMAGNLESTEATPYPCGVQFPLSSVNINYLQKDRLDNYCSFFKDENSEGKNQNC